MPDLIRELLRHYRDLLRHLTHRLRNPDDAADIAQTTFAQVYQHAMAAPGGAAGIESPRALLFRTAHNLCIDQARHRQVVQAWADDRLAANLRPAAPSAEHMAAYRQLVERVVRATLDCARAFAELADSLPVFIEPRSQPGSTARLAEEQA